MAVDPQVVDPPAQEAVLFEVQEQLQRLLASPAFRNSQRYPALLRYVVEQTLAGNADQLKERTLGMAVFHRLPDYDTNADPVVRVTAGEVRKRLAQYYQEHSTELRIDLPPGSYVPSFRASFQATFLASQEATSPALPSEAPAEMPAADTLAIALPGSLPEQSLEGIAVTGGAPSAGPWQAKHLLRPATLLPVLFLLLTAGAALLLVFHARAV